MLNARIVATVLVVILWGGLIVSHKIMSDRLNAQQQELQTQKAINAQQAADLKAQADAVREYNKAVSDMAKRQAELYTELADLTRQIGASDIRGSRDDAATAARINAQYRELARLTQEAARSLNLQEANRLETTR